MSAHDPPLLERLRRIDRRLLVLNRRVRTLLAEREILVARLRAAPGPDAAAHDAHEAHGAVGAPVVPEGFEVEARSDAPLRPDQHASETARVASAWAPEANGAQSVHGVRHVPTAHGVQGQAAEPQAPAAPEAPGARPGGREASGGRAKIDRVLERGAAPAGLAQGLPEGRGSRGSSSAPAAPSARAPHQGHEVEAQAARSARDAGSGIGTVPEVRRHSARNAILGLGAALMSVAALVFAVWAWTAADTGTRALMLLTVTAGVAWLAVPLHRRGLGATAQALGALLVVLLCIDAFLLWALLGTGVDPAGYAAGATAVVAALLALHGRYVPLHANAPVAVVLAQPVPVLIVVSASPGTGSWVWLLAVTAATALVDALVLRVFTPVGLRTTAGVMTVLALGALVFAIPQHDATPDTWWAIAAVLLLAGSAGLLQARGEIREPVSAACLLLLALAPLAASRTTSVLFPGPLAWWWADDLQLLGVPATETLRAGTGTPAGPLMLVPVLAAAGLGAVAVRLLAPHRLVPYLAVSLPLTVLPCALFLGASHAGLLTTALALGTAMLLGSRRIPGDSPWALAIGGCVTLALGLWWSTAVQHSLVATLVLSVSLALLCLHLRPRNHTSRPTEPGPSAQGPSGGGVPEGKSASGATVAATLRSCALALWILTLVAGAVHVMVLAATLEVAPQEPSAPWWAGALITLMCAAFGLSWGGTARPAGIALMPVAVLVAGPALAPLARVVPEVGRGAPTLWQPAHTVLDTSVSGGAATAVAVLVAGAATVALTWFLDRPWWPLVTSFVAPLALLPVPIVLGAPFAPTVALVLTVGAGLLVLAVVAGDRTETRWVPVLVGTVVLLGALSWSLASVYTSVPTLAALAVGALVLLRRGAPRAESPARNAADAAPGVPAWASVSRVARSGAAPVRAVARALHAGAIALWATVLVVGGAHLTVLAFSHDPAVAWWWAAAPVTLVCAAVGLSLGRTLRWTGVALLPVTVLVAGPALPALLAIGPGVHGPWGAPDAALWQPAHAVLGTSTSEGLLTAFAVLVAGAAAMAVTWRLDRARLLAVASLVAPVALIPVPVVLELPFLAALLLTLAVGTALITVAALRRENTVDLWLPGLLGAAVLVWAFGWSLASDLSTVVALLAVAVAGATAAALSRTSTVAVIATFVATGATGGSTLVVPLSLGLPVEHAALLPIALTAAVAAVAPRLRSPLPEAAEVPASLWAVVALVLAIAFGVRGELVALGLACLGVVSLCTALRPDRRLMAVGGTVLMSAALWTALASWDVTVPEAYTAPPALAAIAVGREWSRRADRSAVPSSWLAHSGGLLLLLAPSTVLAVVQEEPVLRILAVVAAGLAVTLWGLRSRLRAPLVIGGTALLVVSVRAFGPPFMDLLVELPNWLPFAVVGAVLLTVGARYEASLRGLRTLRRAYSAMQ